MVRIIIDKSAKNFFNKLEQKQQERIKNRLSDLKLYITKHSMIPFQVMDIKTLKGEWQGFYRLRVGDYRILFDYQSEKKQLIIFDIHVRGSIY
jgi:mRNA interferase RelE/StbE